MDVLPLNEGGAGHLDLEPAGRHHVAGHGQRVGEEERRIAEPGVAVAGLAGELDDVGVGGVADDHRVAGVLAADDDPGEAVGQSGEVAASQFHGMFEEVAGEVGPGGVFTGRAEPVVPDRLIRLDAEHAGANDLRGARAEAHVVSADRQILAGCLEHDLPRPEEEQRIDAHEAGRERAIGNDDRIGALPADHLIEPARGRAAHPIDAREGAVAKHETRGERRVVVVEVREDEVVLLDD